MKILKNFTSLHLSLIAFGVLATAGSIIFFSHLKDTQSLIETKEANKRAEIVLKKISAFKSDSLLISHFIQEDLQENLLQSMGPFNDEYKRIIEKRLALYLRSSPSDVIYGIGIWFEPQALNAKHILFGPYIHQGEMKSKPVLTYEWNTPEYNYPQQEWYRAGVNARGESYFVNPYFDAGLVYVTNSRSFSLDNKIQGVISVDIVMPQLQEIVDQDYTGEESFIYITDRNGNLLAHPLKRQFFEQAQIIDGKDGESLLKYKSGDIDQKLSIHRDNWSSYILSEKDLGWQIVVSSSPRYLSRDLVDIRNIIIVSLIIVWLFLFLVIKLSFEKARENEKSQNALEKSRLQIIQSSKLASLGEMAGGIAHEINNPLAIIAAKVQIIKKAISKNEEMKNQVGSQLAKIEETVSRISNIIKGLRTFARSGEGDPFQNESIQLIVQDTISLCSEKFKNNGVQLIVEDIPNVQISCRGSQVSQVLLNLISNAYDAVQWLPEKWVRVSGSVLNHQKLIIRVVDSGTGIPENIVAKMMEPFYTTKEVGKGTGLGLSISKSIIDDHHGKIYYDSQSPNTCFAVELPLAPAPQSLSA